MYLETQQRVRERFVAAVRETFALEIEPPVLGYPPSLELGELSIAACFELARKLRQPPRKIAEQLLARLTPLESVARVEVAGGGYLNFFLDRPRLADQVFHRPAGPAAPKAHPKILVEHTSINPNKAAHIGHLRNAVLGDTLVRLLRFQGFPVEIQNYIDNTGVQVADVVVGFTQLEKKNLHDVRKLIESPPARFDYYCWDLYARVFQHYEAEPASLAWRSQTLQQVEEGHGEVAEMAEAISTAITRLHLATMQRINVQYDLLVQESEILRLKFWEHAFELLKRDGAIHFEDSGKNRGCWVMRLEDADGTTDESGEDVKIIVRSNGTVTYVGKDIAYHLWKFALLGKDFGYRPFYQYLDGHAVWRTAVQGDAKAPAFGSAEVAYAVIDVRQSYLQNIVAAAFRALGLEAKAGNLHHFAYEVVGLTPPCAEEMGVELSPGDRQRAYIEVSGRKGLGIKADDLIDTLIARALEEVRGREITRDPAEQAECARRIAVGALRYFLIKFSRRMIIAFDFKDALAFEGETGPYLQYTVVRARNIFRKFREAHPDFEPAKVGEKLSCDEIGRFFSSPEGNDFWELTLLAAQVESMVDQALASEEPAALAKYAFRLAQAFNNFYHYHHILTESDATRQTFLLYLVHLASESLATTLDLLGIEIPERM